MFYEGKPYLSSWTFLVSVDMVINSSTPKNVLELVISYTYNINRIYCQLYMKFHKVRNQRGEIILPGFLMITTFQFICIMHMYVVNETCWRNWTTVVKITSFTAFKFLRLTINSSKSLLMFQNPYRYRNTLSQVDVF